MSSRRLFFADDENSILACSAEKEGAPQRSKIHPALLGSDTPESGDPKKVETPVDKNPEEAEKEQIPDIDNADSDSDLEVTGFFANSNQKLPYTKKEDELILKYVLKGENIFKVSSLSLWKQLEAKKLNPRRTYQSLKNRFLRNIRPNLFTNFNHLVKDKATKQKILSKFPELKQQIGRRETLSRIKLPERKPPEIPQNVPDDAVSSTSSKESQGSTEQTKDSHAPDSISTPQNQVQETEEQPAQSEPVGAVKSTSQLPYSDLFRNEVYHKIIEETDGVISICVNLKLKKFTNNSPLGIYEKFKRLERKNKLSFCPTCGRFNKPKKVSPFTSSRESDVLIPDSMDTPKSRKKVISRKTPSSSDVPKSKRKVSSGETQSSKAEKRIRVNSSSEPSNCSPCSPSFLRDVDEAKDIDKDMQDAVQEKSDVAQVAEVSNSATARKDVGEPVENGRITQMSNSEVEGRTTKSRAAQASTSNTQKAKTRRKTAGVAKASSSKSSKKAEATTAKHFRESDEDLDSICEEAMANFRKLIDYEEEQILVRKCLNKNSKRIGLEVVPQTNWDSYFLESSPDEGTPPLTIDYETDSQNNEKESTTETNSSSSLADNMKRMLRSRNKKS